MSMGSSAGRKGIIKLTKISMASGRIVVVVFYRGVLFLFFSFSF